MQKFHSVSLGKAYRQLYSILCNNITVKLPEMQKMNITVTQLPKFIYIIHTTAYTNPQLHVAIDKCIPYSIKYDPIKSEIYSTCPHMRPGSKRTVYMPLYIDTLPDVHSA